MKAKKVISLMLAAMTAVTLFTACRASGSGSGSPSQGTSAAGGKPSSEASTGAGEAQESVTISFWHTYCGSDNASEGFAKALADFQKANPDIRLDIEEVNSAQDSMGTRISTAMAAGELPDVWTYWGGFVIKDLAGNDLLMDGQEYLELSDAVKREDINEAAWDYYTIDGKLQGFPTSAAYPAFICNTELFEQCGLELPETMQDMISAAAVFKEKGIIPLAMGSSGGNPGHFFLSDIEHQVQGGNEAIAGFGESNSVNNEQTTAAAQVICDLQQAGVFPSDTVANGDWGPCFELYNSGKAAMLYSYSWAYSGLTDEMYEKSRIIDMPRIDNCAVEPSKFVQNISNYGFVVSKAGWTESEAKKKALVKFIDFMYSDEVTGVLTDAGNMTVRTNWDVAYQTPIIKDVVDFNAGREVVTSHFNATTSNDGWNQFLIKCDELFAGNITAEKFAEDVQKAYDED